MPLACPLFLEVEEQLPITTSWGWSEGKGLSQFQFPFTPCSFLEVGQESLVISGVQSCKEIQLEENKLLFSKA